VETRVKYHEIKTTARDMLKTAWDIGCTAVDKLLVGDAPKHVVDYSGKPQREAEAVQLVIDGFPTIERTDIAQLSHTTSTKR
jgi:hypothetical protein